MMPLVASLTLWAIVVSTSPVDPADEALVIEYVKAQGNKTFREPSGNLKYPYLVPAGYYQQLWDWDSMQTGTALLSMGSAPYLAGSMKNFLSAVDLKTGMVKGCLTPAGASPAIYHAKPVIIQGALIAANAMGDFDQFKPFLAQMQALDGYWENTTKDASTGLFTWHDQLESGCDNLITSQCPSWFGSGPPTNASCWVASDAYTLASSDVQVWMHREKIALARFLAHFGYMDAAREMNASAAALNTALQTYLWSEAHGYFAAYNTSAMATIDAKTHLLAFPVFAGPSLVSATQAARVWSAVSTPDMLSEYGIRSASKSDPRFTNADYVTPYSNWRGPIWINTNALIAYGLASADQTAAALDIAGRLLKVLAKGLRDDPAGAKAGTAWRECYNSETGAGLAAPGFLNWNMLAAFLPSAIRSGQNPFVLV